MPIRISPTKLQPLRDTLFNKSRYSGADLGRLTSTKPNTLWTWFFVRGLAPAKAMILADAIDIWADEIKMSATRLRRLAGEAEG